MKSNSKAQPRNESTDATEVPPISRRRILRGAAAGTLMLALPWTDVAYALLGGRPAVKPPLIPFRPSRIGEGIIGPYGEVRIFEVAGQILPVFVAANDSVAMMDITIRSPFVRYGTGTSAVTLTSAGIQFGADKVIPWSPDTVRRLIDVLAKDRAKARSVLLLRSALHTSYPMAATGSKSRQQKGKIGAAIAKGSKGLGATSTICTTTTITDTVTRTVTETIEVIKTAEKQYQECYDRQITRDPCKSLGFGAGACAAGVCALTTFVDMVVGFVDVVTTIAEEVTRIVVSCTKPQQYLWSSPWALTDTPFKDGFGPNPTRFVQSHVEEVRTFLRTNGDLLFGPFARCLINGEWSIAALPTPIDLGGGKLTIPYGIKVCLDAACAATLSVEGVGAELGSSFQPLMEALMGLSPETAALLAATSFTPNVAFAALAVPLPEVAIGLMAVILAFIILALIYGVAINVQLSFHRNFTNDFDDNRVCIEHPSFAIPLVKMATLGFAPAELIPPIVTG